MYLKLNSEEFSKVLTLSRLTGLNVSDIAELAVKEFFDNNLDTEYYLSYCNDRYQSALDNCMRQ